ncbi:kinetochore protein SPC25 homolog [Actinidia eriantha]|uniref:kinetochore protein SPC25 homolog n=1 Tax=Actinidia eriantha TaxID=165200 RepID=UPI00258867C9|nr:kinetochore protein SPC25 homolog [Actinidia eriantha]
MEELRLVCDREIPIQKHRMDMAVASFRNLSNPRNPKLRKLKAPLKEAEGYLVKALAVKTRKESKGMVTVDSIASARARTEDLMRSVEDHKTRQDDYAEIISQLFEGNSVSVLRRGYQEKLWLYAMKSVMKTLNIKVHYGEMETAISWYNGVLGFRIECGHGLYFSHLRSINIFL